MVVMAMCVSACLLRGSHGDVRAAAMHLATGGLMGDI